MILCYHILSNLFFLRWIVLSFLPESCFMPLINSYFSSLILHYSFWEWDYNCKLCWKALKIKAFPTTEQVWHLPRRCLAGPFTPSLVTHQEWQLKPVDIYLTVLNKLVTQGMCRPLINDNLLHFTMLILRALFWLLLSQEELGTNPLSLVISEIGNCT